MEKITQKGESQVKDQKDSSLISEDLIKAHIHDLGEMGVQFGILKRDKVDHNNCVLINQEYFEQILKYYFGFNENSINKRKVGKIT